MLGGVFKSSEIDTTEILICFTRRPLLFLGVLGGQIVSRRFQNDVLGDQRASYATYANSASR